MAIGDGERKFGFSRMGMGIEEARQKEAEQRSVKNELHNMKFMDRTARRSYRGMIRKGDFGGAYELATDATSRGLNIGGGIRQAGSLENAAQQRWDYRKAEMSRMNQKQGIVPPGSDAEPEVAAQNPGPLGTALEKPASSFGLSASTNKPADSMDSFLADLSRSKSIKSGNEDSMKNAVYRGAALGLSYDDVASNVEKVKNGESLQAPMSGFGRFGSLLFGSLSNPSIGSLDDPNRKAPSDSLSRYSRELHNEKLVSSLLEDPNLGISQEAQDRQKVVGLQASRQGFGGADALMESIRKQYPIL